MSPFYSRLEAYRSLHKDFARLHGGFMCKFYLKTKIHHTSIDIKTKGTGIAGLATRGEGQSAILMSPGCCHDYFVNARADLYLSSSVLSLLVMIPIVKPMIRYITTYGKGRRVCENAPAGHDHQTTYKLPNCSVNIKNLYSLVFRNAYSQVDNVSVCIILALSWCQYSTQTNAGSVACQKSNKSTVAQ